ncbi:putative ferric-chelate reductase 1 [Stylophora pistillata]|uniref:Putative ferric-chelate reductase 1 n=1 Tax=Stylophora pistillata TaxID=50429 RepID=A0A2B4S8U0_STYPI|nr:putative ferric-chelate reductase 1 [Stylophora pistillata]
MATAHTSAQLSKRKKFVLLTCLRTVLATERSRVLEKIVKETQVTAQVLLLSVSTVLGFSKGPPLSTCQSKLPHHSGAEAQQGPSPYNISVSPLSYIRGDTLTVTISGSQQFKGFLLNAQGTESSIPWPVGTFTQIPSDARYYYCSGGDPKIDKNGCGETKGCYSLPSGCIGSADCSYLFTFSVSDGNVVIEMSAKVGWVAVAFNEKKLMDKMDSIMCATMATNLGELRHFYSIGHSLVRQDLTGNSDITLDKIVYEDGGIKCRVTRKLTSNAVPFRDLTKKWYLLFTWSKTSSSGVAQYHYSQKSVTADMVDLGVNAVLKDEKSQAEATITKDGCGKTKSCYSEPADCKSSKDCDYLVTIKPVGDKGESGQVEFELSAKKKWVAIGFNNEKNKMDGTDALICAVVNDKVTVEHYLADKGYGRPTKTTPTPTSIVATLAESKGGVVACRFRRKKKDDKMVDLTKTWYLVYACGPMSGDEIDMHSTTPKTSPQKMDVSEIGELGAEGESFALVQAHGCLMVIAWIGFASIGMFIARHMKVLFGQKVLLGTKMWFTEAGAHPITGILVLVLAVIQPIMAAFRPHPGEEKRYIFNWAHRGVGLSALILAVVTVFFGLRLPDSRLGDPALYFMIAYCVALILVVAYDIYDTLTSARGGASFNVQPVGGKEDGDIELQPPDIPSVGQRKLLFAFTVVVSVGVVIALLVLIAIADGESHEHNHNS